MISTYRCAEDKSFVTKHDFAVIRVFKVRLPHVCSDLAELGNKIKKKTNFGNSPFFYDNLYIHGHVTYVYVTYTAVCS